MWGGIPVERRSLAQHRQFLVELLGERVANSTVLESRSLDFFVKEYRLFALDLFRKSPVKSVDKVVDRDLHC